MILCDFCGIQNGGGDGGDIYVHDVQAVAHMTLGRGKGAACNTICLFKGQACPTCYENITAAIKQDIAGLRSKAPLLAELQPQPGPGPKE